MAIESIQKAKQKYKTLYDKKGKTADIGAPHKLSRPLHGDIGLNVVTAMVVKVYFPQDGRIQSSPNKDSALPRPSGWVYW